MANEEHLELARKGREDWNKWRAANPDEPVDFSGTDFTKLPKGGVSFVGFRFGDNANFSDCIFGDNPDPDASRKDHEKVGGAIFSLTEFGDWASFTNAKFGASARFVGAHFGVAADFNGATFGPLACFDFASFDDEVGFSCRRFGYGSSFRGACFSSRPRFEGVIFEHDVKFDGASLGHWARFDDSVFEGDASFIGLGGAELQKLAKKEFDCASGDFSKQRYNQWKNLGKRSGSFEHLSFARARFLGRTSFAGRSIDELVSLASAYFYQPPDLYELGENDRLDLTGTRFVVGGRGTRGWTTSTEVATALRRLRRLAGDLRASDAERDLFIVERLAERGIAWQAYRRRRGFRKIADFWRAVGLTILMALYRMSSNYGRSLLLPIIWLGVINFVSHLIYSAMFNASWQCAALWKFTFSTVLPFGALARQARTEALMALLKNTNGELSWGVIGVSILQGTLNVILVFLIGLALRNFFKTK